MVTGAGSGQGVGTPFGALDRREETASETCAGIHSRPQSRRRTVDAGNPRLGSQVPPVYIPQRSRSDSGCLRQACGGGARGSRPPRGWSWETLYEAASRAARRLAILVAQLGDAAGVLELLLRGPCHMPRAAVLPPMRFTSMVETMKGNVAMTSMTAGTTVGIRRSSPRRVGHRGCGPHRWATHYIFEGPRQHAVARYPAVTRYSYPSQRSGSRQAKA